MEQGEPKSSAPLVYYLELGMDIEVIIDQILERESNKKRMRESLKSWKLDLRRNTLMDFVNAVNAYAHKYYADPDELNYEEACREIADDFSMEVVDYLMQQR